MARKKSDMLPYGRKNDQGKRIAGRLVGQNSWNFCWNCLFFLIGKYHVYVWSG